MRYELLKLTYAHKILTAQHLEYFQEKSTYPQMLMFRANFPSIDSILELGHQRIKVCTPVIISKQLVFCHLDL